MSTRLRHLARINPATPEFDRLPDDFTVTFLPLEAVWPGEQLDVSRSRPKHEVMSGYTRFRENDIIVPKITPTFEANRSTIARGLRCGVAAGTTELHVIRAGDGLDTRYAAYLVSSKPFLHRGKAVMIGVAGQKRVPEEFVADMSVPVTDLPYQQAIADFLDAETARIDALVTKKSRMVDLLRGRFLAVVRDLVTDGVRYADPLDVLPEEIPTGWQPARLSWRFRLGSGTTPRAGDHRYYGPGTPWVVTGDLDDSRLRMVARSVTELALKDYPALSVHRAGSLVIAMYGATIGKMAILELEATVNQACCVLSPRSDDRPEFVFYWLLAHRPELIERGRGAGQPNISKELIGTVRIALPARSVQDDLLAKIEAVWRETGSLTTRLSRQIDLLQEHRQGLITAAVKGELDVPRVAA